MKQSDLSSNVTMGADDGAQHNLRPSVRIIEGGMIGKGSNIECGDSLSDTALDNDLDILVRESSARLLPHLQPRLREVFRRAELHDESREAIAASLAISIKIVDSHLQAARTEIRLLLKQGALFHLNQPKDSDS